MNSRDVSRKVVEQCLNLMYDFLNSISLSEQYRSFLSTYSLSYPVSYWKKCSQIKTTIYASNKGFLHPHTCCMFSLPLFYLLISCGTVIESDQLSCQVLLLGRHLGCHGDSHQNLWNYVSYERLHRQDSPTGNDYDIFFLISHIHM